MTWRVEIDAAAVREIKQIRRKHPHLVARLEDILDTLARNPLEPTHNYEPLKWNFSGYHSRRLDSQHRVVYRIDGKGIVVVVIQVMGHY
jgi:toxin YoeB